MAVKPVAKKGLVIVYVGDGKGKTTAAVGLAARAAGTGLNVYVVQFVKGEWPSGERDFFAGYEQLRRQRGAVSKLGAVTVEAAGKGFIKILGDRKPFAEHVAAAQAALALGRRALASGRYDVVVLDEGLSAVESKVLKVRDLVQLIKQKPSAVHLVITGHELPPSVAALADLVSEVKMVKHPYYRGVLAQRGIDY
jgi:cob(I)alamin adenosyltransferase